MIKLMIKLFPEKIICLVKKSKKIQIQKLINLSKDIGILWEEIYLVGDSTS